MKMKKEEDRREPRDISTRVSFIVSSIHPEVRKGCVFSMDTHARVVQTVHISRRERGKRRKRSG
jgi:hypothetical protein